MVDIITQLADLAAALPAKNSHGENTIREVALFRLADGVWQCMAGGHRVVSLGEWGGDFDGSADTADGAIANCLAKMPSTK